MLWMSLTVEKLYIRENPQNLPDLQWQDHKNEFQSTVLQLKVARLKLHDVMQYFPVMIKKYALLYTYMSHVEPNNQG